MAQKKGSGKKLEEKLFSKTANIGMESDEFLGKAFEFSEGYKEFLGLKTEREVVDYAVPLLKKKGYKEFVPGTKYKPGSKIYFNNRGKSLVMATVGKKDISEGAKITISHIDCPRLDMKPMPLFEDSELAFMKTHYYGGIKKYQWPTVPMSLHGVMALKDGRNIKINIGEDEGDPIFCVNDILVHLARDQMKKPAPEIISGEQLNIIVGSLPFKDDESSKKTKLNVANILFEKYGVTEADFLSAELCAVPAVKARDVGIDRSMVGGYGHDDKASAYPCLIAEIENKNPTYTSITVFSDKEETGSDGPTGMASTFLFDFIEEFASPYGAELRTVFRNSMCLSCDVNSAYDPAFSECYEKNNCSYLNHGPAVCKYGGVAGKFSCNDARAEMMAYVRRLFDENEIKWQYGELGRVDCGGGGTVAVYMGNRNIDTVDMGVPVLSMHSTFEIIAKTDLYMMYLALKTFLASKDMLKH